MCVCLFDVLHCCLFCVINNDNNSDDDKDHDNDISTRRRQKLTCGYAECMGQRANSGGGVLGEGEVSSVPPARGSIWYILGFENHIKMVNHENDGFC